MKPFFTSAAELATLLGGRAIGPARAPGPPAGYGLDSRSLPAGGLFFAMPGEKTDGHRFLRDLGSRGAWGAVARDEAAARDSGLPCVLVEDVATALWRLGELKRARIRYPVVAITGSNGKTSTKDLVAAMLEGGGTVAKSQGNFNNALGFPISILNAPEDARVGVFELGMSSRGEVDRLARLVRPELGIITCIAEEHLEFMGTLEECREAEAELIPHLAADGALLLNGDDPSTPVLAPRAAPRRVATVSVAGAPGAAVRFEVEAVSLAGTTGRLTAGGRSTRLTWPVPGRHLVYPLLFGIAAAAELGIPLDPERDAPGWQARLTATKGRMKVRRAGPVEIVDDSYNANPRSMGAALDFVAEVAVPGKKLAVLGDMLEMGAASGPSHAAMIERVAADPRLHRVWLVGACFREAAGRAPGSPKVRAVADRAAALAELRAELGEGDLVLVKGSRGIGLDWIADQLVAGTAGGGSP